MIRKFTEGPDSTAPDIVAKNLLIIVLWCERDQTHSREADGDGERLFPTISYKNVSAFLLFFAT